MDEVKEYVQLTIDDYLHYKKQLTQELNNLANGFIRAGYYLKKIRDAEAYRNDGYKSIYEFAEKEYGITRTVASRFMSINDEFSEGGYSLELMEQYKGLGSSRLTEMLTLDTADHEMITNVTRIEDIRELKRFEKQDPDTEATQYHELYRNFFEGKEKEFNAVMQLENIKDIAEIVNPSGNKTWKYRMLFMAMKEYAKGISIKDLLKPVPDTITWQQFVEQCRDMFVYDDEAAGTPYEQNYKKEEERSESGTINMESGKEEQEAEKKVNQQREQELEDQRKETEKKKEQKEPEPSKGPESLENVDFPQCEAVSNEEEKEPETTEIRCNEPEVVTGEVENTSNEVENKVCDIAQTTDLLNTAGFTITLPAAIGEEIYAIVPESMDEKGKCRYKYTIIKPYLYEIRGKDSIKMYYHKDSGDSESVDIRHIREKRIYPDIVDEEQILEILEELNGKEK